VRRRGRNGHEKAGAITQSDVARVAKVSTGTVSRVINDQPQVSEKAKRKVQEAIKQLGYRPNKSAQALVKGETKNILLLCIDESPIMPSTWQYELPILQGIESYLKRFGYTLDICMPTHGEVLSPDFMDRLLWSRVFDGILILTAWSLERSIIKDLCERKIPTICVGNGPYREKGIDICGSALFDNYYIIKDIFSTLFDLGHRRIAFIKGTAHHQHGLLRFKGYRQALREHGISFDPRYECCGSYNIPSGYSAMELLLGLAEPPSAVIASNDLMAIGAIRAINDHGLRVPHNISIVGFDDLEISEFLEPSLSSVKVPSWELGTMSAESLYHLIQQPTIAGRSITLPVTFAKRNSIGARL
jgi:LacI family transcriptional regulator